MRGARFLLVVLGLVSLGTAATAIHADEDPGVAKVRRIYAVWQGTKDNKADTERPPGVPESIWRNRPTVDSVNREVFFEAFIEVPFDTWDPEVDAALLRAGLRLTALGGRSIGKPDLALDAARRLLALDVEHADAPRIRALEMPAALLASGDVEGARAQARAHAGRLSGLPGARARMLLGDLEAVCGGLDEAREAFTRAHALTHEHEEAEGGVPRDAENRDVRARLEIRIRLVGAPLPKLVRTVGAGNVTKALAGRSPRYRALWFFSPSEENHLRQLLWLDQMSHDIGVERFSAVGVTWFENLAQPPHPRGMYVPTSRDDPATGMTAVEKASKLRAPLVKLREGLALEIPIAIVKAPHARTWLPASWQTALLVVTDPEGRVALATHADEPVLTDVLVRHLVGP